MGVPQLDALPAAEAERSLLMCCACTRWAAAVTAGRPYGSRPYLFDAAQRELERLEWRDVLEALEAHPKIGDRVQARSREAEWSRQEQSGVGGAAAKTLRELAEGNVEYEQRFGHVFLICATGKPAEAMLRELRQRLTNDPITERSVVRAELAAITALRLERLAAETPEPAR